MKPKKLEINYEIVPEVGDIINIQAYKYDGLLYRQWNGAKVLEVSPSHIALVLIKTKVTEGNNRKWIIREPTLWFFPLNKFFFNASILLREKGNFYYINLSSPPLFEDNTLKFIDFDLDVKINPKQKYSLVDQNEFKKNANKFNYSEELIKMINKNVRQIKSLYQDNDYIFNEEYVNSYITELKDLRIIREDFKKNRKKRN